MKRIAIGLLVFAVSGCVTPETKGSVIALNGSSVTIRGSGDYSVEHFGKPFTPTAAMTAQAQSICPKAEFLSATPVSVDSYMVDYLFKC